MVLFLYNIIYCIIILASSFQIGNFLLKRIILSKSLLHCNLIFSIGIGLSLIVVLLTFLGYIGLLYGYLIKLVIYPFAMIFFYKLFLNFKFLNNIFILFITKNHLVILVSLAFLSTLYFCSSLAPTLDGDSLFGYISLPREYFKYGKLLPIDYYYGSVFPQNGQLITTLGFLLNGQITGQVFVSWFMGILCCFTIYSLGRMLGDKRSGLIAILIWYGTYSIAFIHQSAKIDLAWTFFDLLGIYAFFIWCFKNNSSKNINWLFISGFLVSIAIGIKQASAFTAIVIFFGIFIKYYFFDKKSYLAIIKGLFLFSFPIILSFHWIIRTFVLSGSLLYNASGLPNNYGVYGIFQTLWEMSMLGGFTSFEGPMGKTIGPVLLAILPFFFIMRKIDKKVQIILIFCFIMSILWYNGVQRARHFYPTLALLSVCSGYLLNFLSTYNKTYGNFFFRLVIICSLFNVLPWVYVNFISLNKLDFIVNQDIDAYLSKNLDKHNWYPNYRLTKFINENVPRECKIAALSTGNSYYLDRKFYSIRATILGESFTESKENISSVNFYKKLKKFGITHIFLNDFVIEKYKLQSSFLNSRIFQKKYMKKIMVNSGQTIFELL